MTCARVQAGVDLAHVVLLCSFTEGHETERFGIQIRISPQNIKDNARGWAIVTGTNNHSIANNEELLAFVVILHLSKGVVAQGSVTFSVTWHLTDEELVMVFRSTSRSKLMEARNLKPMINTMMTKTKRTRRRLAIVHFPDSEQIA